MDASAWFKRYYEEIGSDFVKKYFVNKEKIACSSLGYVEVFATLARKYRAKEINKNDFEQKIEKLEKDWFNFIQIQITEDILVSVKVILKEQFLKSADAIHLSSALNLKQNLNNRDKMLLISSDHQLNNAARSYGIEVIDPEEV
jgi:uncharacterized protein